MSMVGKVYLYMRSSVKVIHVTANGEYAWVVCAEQDEDGWRNSTNVPFTIAVNLLGAELCLDREFEVEDNTLYIADDKSGNLVHFWSGEHGTLWKIGDESTCASWRYWMEEYFYTNIRKPMSIAGGFIQP